MKWTPRHRKWIMGYSNEEIQVFQPSSKRNQALQKKVPRRGLQITLNFYILDPEKFSIDVK